LPAFPIDENGRLLEWQNNFEEPEPGHRHLSHLLCFHPFADITSDTPELFDAARRNLDHRIESGQGKGGGWSGAHSSLMYAWFLDGEKAFEGVQTLLNSNVGTLLNAKNIFQIDANFGATSVIAEMLIQSQMNDGNGNHIIHLLPAIPCMPGSQEV
jgi:alpha-L-fucosidase 2